MSEEGLKDFESFKCDGKKKIVKHLFFPAEKSYLLMILLNQYFNGIFSPRNLQLPYIYRLSQLI